ncbi:uncharacterized protein LOC131672881 [Phymastichus coffea]|uniref:uncharacterized protein LOC131672881 n=1 Tax=Phymastichus coffea TaxID=108790 RepID=UPI00273AED41|nr:uncharacterized protein LOC131672881 [Phymastichus coffea]XP_058806379.1 uncharacterized protein LOC131672881 [Phymastichus coffea]XP_058806381.1 uncharacterized protein LOC131672881 [Phymastichus coffea]XP_058806382.1 uncharacterized protein LOC131672881 [Phymastichus coffea]
MPSAIAILTIASVILSESSVLSENLLNCEAPRSYEVTLASNHKLIVQDQLLYVNYDRNELAVYEYPDNELVNILVNDSRVIFRGLVITDNDFSQSFDASRTFDSKIAGTARLKRGLLSECSLYLSRNRHEEASGTPRELQVEIIHQAAVCARATLCDKLGVIDYKDLKRGKEHPFNFGRLAVPVDDSTTNMGLIFSSIESGELKVDVDEVKALFHAVTKSDLDTVDTAGLQSTINKLVDLAVYELVKKIKEENIGKIKIPDMSQNFSTGSSWWETTGEFNSLDGTFEDLTSLARTEDALLSHSGMKFVASCGFGLRRAYMEYQKYKLRYGVIKVNGQLSATIDGVSISAVVGIDYNRKPCRTVLESLRVSELGKIKVKLTGLGPLNKLLSKLITWITKKWQDEIVGKIEEKLSELVIHNLDKFQCEKYRPW